MYKLTGAYIKTIAGLGLSLVVMSSFALDNNPALSNQTATPVYTDNNSSRANTVLPSNVVEQANPAAQANATVQTTASAQPNSRKINNTGTAVSSTSQLASVLGGLILIIALIMGLSWFVKRFSQGGFLQNPTMKILASMPLGTRERLMLVDVGGQQLLLGVTATAINTLHVFAEPVILPTEKNAPPVSEFSQKLMAILQQKNIQQPDLSPSKNTNS